MSQTQPKRVNTFWNRPDPTQNSIVQTLEKALEERYEEPAIRSAKVIAEQARKDFETTSSNYEALDKKADEMQRTALALAAAEIGATAALKIPPEAIGVIAFSVIFLVIAIWITVRTRTPASMRAPLSSHDLIRWCEHRRSTPDENIEDGVHGVIAASYTLAKEANKVLTDWKSLQLEWSGKWLLAGVATLALIPPVILFCHLRGGDQSAAPNSGSSAGISAELHFPDFGENGLIRGAVRPASGYGQR